MKLHYYPDTDSLYIELRDNPSVDSVEANPGIVLDFDEQRNLVGIDIENASQKLRLNSVEATNLPLDTPFMNRKSA